MASLSKQEAAAELLRRRAARAHLLPFIRYINDSYFESDFSRRVCSELELFLDGVIAGERPVLIIGAPPQHGKSEMVSRCFPAWAFGKYPDLAIGGLSYGKDLATDMNRDVQRIMLGEEYHKLFPGSALNQRRVVTMEMEAKRNSDMFEIVGRGGRYISQGVGGPLTGKRLDIGIIDDPIKNAEEALSEKVKSAIWNWYTSTFITRLSKNSGQIIMATRWATDDLSGRIIENNKNARVLVFPAINEDGKALVPELHPVEKLLETKATLSGHFWSAMYQQSPVTIGGGIFKDEWWQYYRVPPTIKWRGIYGDTAQKTKEQNDYSVFQCWGYSSDGKAVLLDQMRGKWEAPELLTTAKAFWAKHKAIASMGPLRHFKIEDKSSGTGLIQSMKKGTEPIPVAGIPRETDKVTRAYDAAPYIEAGRVMIQENAPWLSDYLAEFRSFPNGSHDDQIDPTMDAIKDMLGGNQYSLDNVL